MAPLKKRVGAHGGKTGELAQAVVEGVERDVFGGVGGHRYPIFRQVLGH